MFKESTNNSLKPYTLTIEKGVNAIEESPYFIHTQIIYSDTDFGKRMNKIFKSSNIGIHFEFQEKSVGSFLNPKYEPVLYMKLIENRSALIEASKVARLATLGFANPDVENNSMKLETIFKQKVKFTEKIKAQLFSNKLEEILTPYFKKEYETYQSLLKEEF